MAGDSANYRRPIDKLLLRFQDRILRSDEQGEMGDSSCNILVE
jgi:hypothetical protein